jgi:hypothetical protein
VDLLPKALGMNCLYIARLLFFGCIEFDFSAQVPKKIREVLGFAEGDVRKKLELTSLK